MSDELPPLFVLIIPLSLAALAFWVWALTPTISNPRLDSNMRLIWVLVILFASWLGAIIYLALGRNPTPPAPPPSP